MGLDLSNYNIEEASHLTIAPDDEYRIRITDMKLTEDGDIKLTDKTGQMYLLPTLEIIEDENAENYKEFTCFMRLPNEEMSPKEKKQCLANLKDFGKCFSIDFSGRVDETDFKGSEGTAILSVREDDGYGEQNTVKQFLIPR